MLTFYTAHKEIIQPIAAENLEADITRLAWIDLLEPTEEEEQRVERLLGTDIPTREEMHEIELSSRLYERNEALFATATMVVKTDTPEPETHAVTFVLAQQCLVTVRYVDSRPFKTFLARSKPHLPLACNGSMVFVALLEVIVDRMADVLEFAGHNIDAMTRRIFNSGLSKTVTSKVKPDYEELLIQIGINGDLISKARESMVSITRLVSFISQTHYFKPASDEHNRLGTVMRDMPALSDHASFLSNKVNFLLDTTLGMISIEQNAIIKIFSVAAVMFMPPTLVASVYGMNFHAMPELQWQYGYPMAIGLMILSGYLPYKFFKSKGWL
jgi:magnesium transporter